MWHRYKFKASLGYRVNFRLARATKSETLFQEPTEQKQLSQTKRLLKSENAIEGSTQLHPFPWF